MKSSWSSLRRRVESVRAARRRGQLALFLESFSVAFVTPALVRLPPEQLNAFLEWMFRRPARTPGDDPEAVASMVLDMLEAARPFVRAGCLTRGMALYFALRRAAVDATLTFGMGSVAEGDGYDGHCWVVLLGEPFRERRDPRRHFVPMYSFGRGAVARRPSV